LAKKADAEKQSVTTRAMESIDKIKQSITSYDNARMNKLYEYQMCSFVMEALTDDKK